MTDVNETAKLILAEVASAKGFTEARNIGAVFLSAETIISGLAYLVGPMLDAEQVYRQKRLSYINDGMTAAAAEAHAKATDEYKYWRKLEHVYDLGEQQTQLLKKFGPLLEAEYKRS